MIEIPQLSHYLSTLAPILLSLFVVLSCTTSSSISLEGNNLWILKSSPVSKQAIWLSKVAVNLTITLPVLSISSVMLMISLRTGWMESLLLLVIPLIYACYSALMGIIVNLKLPNLEWKSEVTVIKQSAAVLVSMLIGIISLLVPLGLSLLLTQVNANLLLLGVGMIMIAACLAMYRYMQTKGAVVSAALNSRLSVPSRQLAA